MFTLFTLKRRLVCFLKISVILVLFQPALVFAAAASSEVDIVDAFKRAVTRGGNSFVPLDVHHENSFHYHPWVDKCKHPNAAASAQHSEFSDVLYERLKKNEGSLKNLNEQLILGDPRDEAIITSNNDYSFVPGHMIKVEEITKNPKILVTLYAGNSTFPKSTRWFMPIEQALCCATLGDYRKKIAVLRTWDAYTHFALLVIPPGTKVKYYVGLAAPQSLPALNFKDKKTVANIHQNPDMQALKYTLPLLKRGADDIHHFFEELRGGATQIYMVFAAQHTFFDLGSLDFPRLAGKMGFAVKRSVEIILDDGKKKRIYVWPDNTALPSHLKDVTYDLVQIDIIDKLYYYGILNLREMMNIKEIAHRQQNPVPIRAKL